MLWSLAKILFFVVIVVLVALGAGMLMETNGGFTLQYADVELSLSLLQAALLLVALIVALWVILKLASLMVAILKFINGDETAFSRYFDRSRERRGFEALAEGLIALASGDTREAMAKAKKADKLLDKTEVTSLVIAQAAEQAGDRATAAETYKKLLSHSKTKFVGVQGLLKQKLLDNDTETALKLAEHAFALKPKLVETQDTLLQLQASEEDWHGARSTLGAKLKHGQLPRDVHRRRDGVLALAEARELRAEGKLDAAHELTIEANRLTPSLVAAAVLAARGYIEQDKPRMATKVLQTAWDLEPHPELAAEFASMVPDEDPAARLKRFRALTKYASDHAETKMLLAELNMTAGDYASARKALGSLPDDDPTMRSLTILAAIERGEGKSDAIVHACLTKAISAPRDPEWICESCGETHKDWEPVCLNCEAMDSIAWKRPSHSGPAKEVILPTLIEKPKSQEVLDANNIVVFDNSKKDGAA